MFYRITCEAVILTSDAVLHFL